MKTLNRYLEERKSLGLSQSTQKQDSQILRALDAFLKKPFENATKEDMIRFLNTLQDSLKAGSIHNYKFRIKHFYSWLFQCEHREYPSAVRWIRGANPRTTKTKGLQTAVKPEDLLNDEDILKLIEAADHPRDQALIAFIYETGAEAIETLKLKIGSIQFDQHGAVVSLTGTGGTRRLRIVDSVPYLLAWLNVHPERKNNEAPLWVLIKRKNRVKALSHQGLYKNLQRFKRRAGITKPVKPTFLRHACLTKMAKVLPEQKLKVFAGWNPDSKMAAVYVHLSGKDLDEDILALHGKVAKKPEPFKESPLRPRECPRCKKENPPTARFCMQCSMILDKKEAATISYGDKEFLGYPDAEKFVKFMSQHPEEFHAYIAKWNELMSSLKVRMEAVEEQERKFMEEANKAWREEKEKKKRERV